ncbi:uncharacterized protein LOC115759291 [Drosophila novamexicana]|uniref:uncharacterized protein LOC115759291 n=1 Tax=Drosophila novamexicana TaxID=47314 RepID=UPI0011E5C113|nr:uncharacterized protein LOC115759291 [Drosophila novamexicana]
MSSTCRVIRSSNFLLLLTGYQMHWFDAKQQRYRISLPGVVNVFVLACVYAGCFAQHFQPSALLKTLQDVSPFLYDLTRLQLVLSIKVFSYAIYASVRAVGVASALTASLPMKSSPGRRRVKKELLAYGLLCSTFVVLLCFGLYIGYELEFKLPPLKDIMIGSALFLPHLVLAGALRFYSIFAWLARERLQQLQAEVDELLTIGQMRTEMQLVSGTSSVAVAATPSSMDSLLSQCEQLQQLATNFGNLFESLEHSLLLLLGINANCLLFGAYAFVYYSSTWYVLFDDRRQRIFYAGNASIYACIGCDYACLLLAQTLLEQQVGIASSDLRGGKKKLLQSRTLFKEIYFGLGLGSPVKNNNWKSGFKLVWFFFLQSIQFSERLSTALGQRNVLPKRMRRIAKDMRTILSNCFRLKFLSIWRFDVANFTLLQLLQLLIIALIVIYHYLNDAIQLANERFDSNNDE